MDDEHSLRLLMAALLERMGYQVDAAADGTEAVALYRERLNAQRPYHLVILDMHIHGELVGPSVLEALREMDPAVNAIAASGSVANDLPSLKQTSRFAAFLPKPFEADELIALVASLVADRN